MATFILALFCITLVHAHASSPIGHLALRSPARRDPGSPPHPAHRFQQRSRKPKHRPKHAIAKYSVGPGWTGKTTIAQTGTTGVSAMQLAVIGNNALMSVVPKGHLSWLARQRSRSPIAWFSLIDQSENNPIKVSIAMPKPPFLIWESTHRPGMTSTD